MSVTQTISISNVIDGVATDYDSVPLLRDQTLTYGVRAVVGGTIIVDPGTAMTRTALGQYAYPVTGLTAGLSYQFSIEKVLAGQTTWTDPATFVAETITPAGYYAALQDLYDLFGPVNIATWSSMDGTGALDTTKVQAALDYADSVINGFFADGPFIVPLTFTGAFTFSLAKHWSAVLAGAGPRLYGDRGQADEGTKNQYATMIAGVMSQMAMYKGGALRLPAQRRWPTPNAPAGVGF